MTRHSPRHFEVVGFASVRCRPRLVHGRYVGASISARVTELQQSPLFSFGQNLTDLCACARNASQSGSFIRKSRRVGYTHWARREILQLQAGHLLALTLIISEDSSVI